MLTRRDLLHMGLMAGALASFAGTAAYEARAAKQMTAMSVLPEQGSNRFSGPCCEANRQPLGVCAPVFSTLIDLTLPQ